ncbi:3-hydroxyacyl-CoA dehydrogenase [Stagnihabitans tardus]|uniref:3-hydroxybutyryl-CoA dehydrogenase n=1 Tax=Stagnihabitans tardus TaxID=2699202 RepID=A0AAE4YAB0_9RHOB|nr:3-hydroxyacyl-CoA dehydrogenase NAD-binding domain-containing protein [Stagnihabitans tardus]NBZ86365.1 3-hydroxybutyryl-CoA dehydrogenase [Stagnihabitans tardus]
MIAVIGLGAMGLGIAQVFAQSGASVRATDQSPEARASAPSRLRAALEPRVAKGAMTAEAMEATLSRLTVVDSLEDLAPADLVIEAVAERLAVKQAVFATLEPLLAANAVLATNTSSLSVGAIAQGLTRPGQVLGLHFFNPAPVMKLVELIAHPGTSPEALAQARALTEAAGKVVISCADRPGFIVNRCARPYYGEALALVEEGRSAPEIDAAMMAHGYKLGPFALIDLIGADINLAATEGLSAAMGQHPRYHVFQALRAQVASGKLGRKTGSGFISSPAAAPPDADAIALRIEATLVNEAAWVLSEGGVTAGDIDTAMTLGLNFPRGPFAALERHGRDAIRATLAALEARAPLHLKTRYMPAPILA